MWDIPDSSRAPNERLILDGIEDLADGESQQSEMMFHWLMGLERIW